MQHFMGTTKEDSSLSPDKGHDFNDFRKSIHERAKKIIQSSIPERLTLLTKICAGIEHMFDVPDSDFDIVVKKDENFLPKYMETNQKRNREEYSYVQNWRRRELVKERNYFLSYVDDLLLSLNLRQLQQSERGDTFQARKG